MAAASSNTALREHPVGQLVLRAADAVTAKDREEMRTEVLAFEHPDFTESQKTLLRHMIAAVPALPSKSLRQYMLAVFSPIVLGEAYVSRDKSSVAPIKSVIKVEDVVLHLMGFLPFEDAVNATLALETPCYSQRLEHNAIEPRVSRLITIFEKIARNHYQFRKEYTGPHDPSRRILGFTKLDDFNSSPHLERIAYTQSFQEKAASRIVQGLKKLKVAECTPAFAKLFRNGTVKKLTIRQGHHLQHSHLVGHEGIEHLAVLGTEFPFRNIINLAGFQQLHTLELLDVSFLLNSPDNITYPQVRNLIVRGALQPQFSLSPRFPNLRTVTIRCGTFQGEVMLVRLPPIKVIKDLRAQGIDVTIEHLTAEQYIFFMEENERAKKAALQEVLNQAKALNQEQHFIPWMQPLEELLSDPEVSADTIIDRQGPSISAGIVQFNRFTERFRADESARVTRYFDPNTPQPALPPLSHSRSSLSSAAAT